MTIVGPNAGGTFASDSGVGTVAWTDAANAGASDNSYATAALTASAVSEYLKATNFSFSLPTDATVDGIEVNWERSPASSGLGQIVDNQSRIVKGGTISGDDKASATVWTAPEQFATYGGTGDLWGLSWAYTDINASTFGAALSVKEQDGVDGDTAQVDFVRIYVTYTSAADEEHVAAIQPYTQQPLIVGIRQAINYYKERKQYTQVRVAPCR